jgi:spermidine/putrescine transport system permease protein
MDRLRRYFLLPAIILQVVCFLLPMALVLWYSFLTRGAYGGQSLPLTAENYQRLIDPLYGVILLRSVLIAGTATALCLLAAFPLALFIARSQHREAWLQLLMLPFWTSLLIRTYAWIFLLRDTGVVNTLLLALGIIDAPLPLLYNTGAVLLGLVYSYLPFAVLPIYGVLERQDRALEEAAADLGATPIESLRHVTLPLALPGLKAAGLLTFIPCLGAFLTSDLLGGSQTMLIGNLVHNQFTNARDWPFGAALSIALLALVLILLFLAGRGRAEEESDAVL